MGNNAAAGHVIAFSGVTQAAGFHKTLGQMMYQYGITPWDPKAMTASSLQTQQQLQASSPLRFIAVEDGLRFYGSQLGGVLNQLTREKFVQMSMQLFQQRGLHVPVDEARQFYEIFDSIDLYKNATLSLGELAGGLSSFFGGTVEAKTKALFDVLARGGGQITKATLQELLKPFVWCMVPPNAEVLRPILLPHVAEEIYTDMSFRNSGSISQQELQRWSQKGLLAQGAVNSNQANMSAAIIDRTSQIMSMALQVAWRDYDEKYKLQQYGQETWQQNYGNQPQQLRDVGAYRYAKQAAPAIQGVAPMSSIQGYAQNARSAVSAVPIQRSNLGFWETAQQNFAGAFSMVSDTFGGNRASMGTGELARTRTYSVDSTPPSSIFVEANNRSLNGGFGTTTISVPQAAPAANPGQQLQYPGPAATSYSAQSPRMNTRAPMPPPAPPPRPTGLAGNPYLQPSSLLNQPSYAQFRR